MTMATTAQAPVGLKTDLFINGRWEELPDRPRIQVHNPAAGEIIAEIPDARPEDGRPQWMPPTPRRTLSQPSPPVPAPTSSSPHTNCCWSPKRNSPRS
ncbi:hypothetical protein StoSoilA2_26020 [Arthrobacter sp. StoSoilA2]|nr:hypothetical protein StoSoilA2_26020 [Arthrobacter sp. StoSoilA2]